MKEKYILIILITLIVNISYVNNFPSSCSKVTHGICLSEAYAVCEKEYATKEDETDNWCEYKRKKQLTYFLIETIAAFGVGHIYAKNYKYGIPKLIYWIISWSLILTIRIISVKKGYKNDINCVCSLLSFLLSIGMIVWYIYDVVMIGENRFTDGEGVDILPW